MQRRRRQVHHQSVTDDIEQVEIRVLRQMLSNLRVWHRHNMHVKENAPPAQTHLTRHTIERQPLPTEVKV
jgi:hypothetical protein